MKQRIRINESQFKQIVKECVKILLNEEFGVDFDNTIAWVKKKHPEMSEEEQEKFANNIINKRKKQNTEKAEDISSYSTKWEDAIKKIEKYYPNSDFGEYDCYDLCREIIVSNKKLWVYDILNKLPAQHKRRVIHHEYSGPEEVENDVKNVFIKHGESKCTFICDCENCSYELSTRPYLNANQYIMIRRRPYRVP